MEERSDYTQSPEHIAKRAKAVEGSKNGRWVNGRRSYRDKLEREGKIKPGSKKIVHHKNENRDENHDGNLEVVSRSEHEHEHKRASKKARAAKRRRESRGDSLAYLQSKELWLA